MKFKRGKVLIIGLMCLMIALTILFSVVKIFHERKEEDDTSQASLSFTGEYTFRARELSSADPYYTENSTFHIKTASGLYMFSESVAAGCSFEMKKVVLDKDINWNDFWNHFISDANQMIKEYNNGTGEMFFLGSTFQSEFLEREKERVTIYRNNGAKAYWQPIGELFTTGDKTHDTRGVYGGWYSEPGIAQFMGEFDGQGHTISNLYCEMKDSEVGSGDIVGLGFFGRTKNATIRNLCLDNISVKNYNTETLLSYMAAMVGIKTDNLIIENCILKNIKVTFVKDCHSSYYAGFFCRSINTVLGVAGKVNIKDCYIDGFSKYTDGYTNWQPSEKFISYIGPSMEGTQIPDGTEKVEEFIQWINQRNQSYAYQNVVIKNYDVSYAILEDILKGAIATDPDTGQSYIIKGVELTKVYTSFSAARNAIENSDVWYVPNAKHNYNDKFPCLALFTKLNTYTLKASGEGTIDGVTQMRVPDGETIQPSTWGSVVNEWDCNATVRPNDGYKFAGFEYQARPEGFQTGDVFTAWFISEEYELKIEVYDEFNKLYEFPLCLNIRYNEELIVEDASSTIYVKGYNVYSPADYLFYNTCVLGDQEDLIVGDYNEGQTITLKIYLKYKNYGIEVS